MQVALSTKQVNRLKSALSDVLATDDGATAELLVALLGPQWIAQRLVSTFIQPVPTEATSRENSPHYHDPADWITF